MTFSSYTHFCRESKSVAIYAFYPEIKLDWMESELSGDFLDYPESFYTIQTFSGLSRQFLNYPDGFWIVQTVFTLSGQSLDHPDSF